MGSKIDRVMAFSHCQDVKLQVPLPAKGAAIGQDHLAWLNFATWFDRFR